MTTPSGNDPSSPPRPWSGPPFSLPDPEPGTLGKRIHQVIQSNQPSAFSDFALISSDAVSFHTSRMLLQITSPYFETMLTSDFCEKNMSQVTVSISAHYLEQILEFIYIDDCTLLRTVSEKRNGHLLLKHDLTCKTVAELIELASAADFLQMHRLTHRCQHVLSTAIRQQPHFISVVLQQLYPRKSTWGNQLYREAFDRLASCFKEALLCKFPGCDCNPGCLHFDDIVAEQVFSPLARNERPQVPMHSVFNALVVWASKGTVLKETKSCPPCPPDHPPWDPHVRDLYPQHPHRLDPYRHRYRRDPYAQDRCMELYARRLHKQAAYMLYDIDMDKMVMSPERSALSRKIAESFNLCSFDGRFLRDIVEKSNLVEQHKFLAAYRTLCVQYEDQRKGKPIVKE